MLGSLLMVEACSETDREDGELVSEVMEPKNKTGKSFTLVMLCPFFNALLFSVLKTAYDLTNPIPVRGARPVDALVFGILGLRFLV